MENGNSEWKKRLMNIYNKLYLHQLMVMESLLRFEIASKIFVPKKGWLYFKF
jgi:hypothetical protein